MTRENKRPTLVWNTREWPCYHCGAYNRHIHGRPRPYWSRRLRRGSAPFAAEVMLLAFICIVMVWLMWRSPELVGPGAWRL